LASEDDFDHVEAAFVDVPDVYNVDNRTSDSRAPRFRIRPLIWFGRVRPQEQCRYNKHLVARQERRCANCEVER